ncbi:MAG: hypothetical protein A3C84_00210 [Candidatus Ryanbacteria bacterium RIFCSPHIGHO2_02_FULL_48_12]|uniref:Phospholipase C/D domain-containing protein n=1 Tax=Candidatus Ryanbacteria bacterium RIFCSPHIGHO2_01_FULL_48_27 TaxID=1802115 RepID=A0A1G2G5T0_9BACT|nr:MAG: hypothetical protein A2756_00230 [Candidatus Ryanbacteria bacterium RIFCSPHIGHO2_01_FULL_48_27]OGZ50399.1 MAG: hypothetical protein A3C84_00210 [Candidatus Ryanbacteria bacterium RIFCSPHIGHO2_02_FULL_48_12]
MDIFSHGLWAVAAAKAAKQKTARPVSLWFAAFWGMFPDLFAFSFFFFWMFWNIAANGWAVNDFPRPDAIEPIRPEVAQMSFLSHRLYDFSHSVIVFLVIFFVIWLIRHRPSWEMIGWPLHILIDIPTHSYQFYPTPVFWPLWEWKFPHGHSWVNWKFLVINYALILIVFYWLRRRDRSLQSR